MKKILSKPENLFVIICLFFSGIFMLLNPPFQAPDEDAHLFKMYGYTIGSLNFKKENHQSGQVLPKSIVFLQNYYDKFKYNHDLKTSLNEMSHASKIELKKNETAFFKHIPASYTPISYFPSFIILFLLKIFGCKPMAMIYIMRFCSLLTYLALTYYAIKITPTKKWLFFLFAILPLNLYQASAISTDALTFGLIFLFIAYTLKLALDSNIKTISKKQTIKWALLITLINICKLVYFPLILLYFLIPKEKFSSAKTYFLNFISIVLINSVFTLAIVVQTILLSKGTVNELSAITVDKTLLIKDILKHPFEYLSSAYSTTVYLYKFYIDNMISSFGWTGVMIPIFTSNLYYLLFFLAAIYTPKEEQDIHLSIKNKFFIVFAILISYIAVLTSVYLIYQRYPLIVGVQGRYLTPLLPLVFLLLINKIIKTENKIIPPIIFWVSQFILFTAVLTLIARFY